MGDPVKKLVQQIGVGMTGGNAGGDFLSDKVCGMFEFCGVIHVTNVACPEGSAAYDAQKAAERCVVIQGFIGRIGV